MNIALSKMEAMHFMESVLGIKQPQVKLSEDFLRKLVRLYVEHIPFQNIQLLAKAYHGHNNVPLWSEIKEDMMAGRGGLCYTVGVFLKVLLETLGYNVYFISCMIKKPYDHICTVVNNLSHEGSEHLVDVNGYPNFEVIPLDFTEISPVYKNSFCSYYFKRIDNKTIQRYNLKGMIGNEYIFGTFKLEPQLLESFFSSMEYVYTNSLGYPFLYEVRAISFLGGKCTAVRGVVFLQEDDNQTLQKTTIDNARTAEVLKLYFHQIPSDTVADALTYLENNRQTSSTLV